MQQCARQCSEEIAKINNIVFKSFGHTLTWPWKFWTPWPLQSPKSRPKQTMKYFKTLIIVHLMFCTLWFFVQISNLYISLWVILCASWSFVTLINKCQDTKWPWQGPLFKIMGVFAPLYPWFLLPWMCWQHYIYYIIQRKLYFIAAHL